MDQVFLLAKYKIVKLWSKNEKKLKFQPKMKKNEEWTTCSNNVADTTFKTNIAGNATFERC